MIRAVLFDLGGTLLDNANFPGWAATARELGLAVEEGPLARAYGEVQGEYDVRKAPESPGFWSVVLERSSGTRVSETTARAFQDRWFASGRPPPPLFPDVLPCLERLEADGIRMGLISNSRSEEACRGHLLRLGIQRFLPVVVSSGTEGVDKPDPEIFRRGVQRVGVAAPEALYVGDLPFTDARGAEAAGLHGLWLDRAGRSGNGDPPSVRSLREVPAWRARLAGEGSETRATVP